MAAVGAIGIAVIAVGGGVLVLSALNSRATSEIEGTAHVLSASAPPSGVTHGRCRLNLVLYGKGIDGVGVKIRDAAVPVAKWPDAGTELPVMISIDKPQRSRVLWGDVATHREAAEERARAREAKDQAVAMAAEDNEYANLDAALDNLDLDRDIDADAASTVGRAAARGDRRRWATVRGSRGGWPTVRGSRGRSPTSRKLAPVAHRRATRPSATNSETNVSRPGLPVQAEPAMATSGTRTIEMDVMDPSVMRWTGPPPGRPYGSRPSPFRRRRPERDGPAEPAPDDPPRDAVDATPAPDADPGAVLPAEADPGAVLPVDDDRDAVMPVDDDTFVVASMTAMSPLWRSHRRRRRRRHRSRPR